MTPFAWPSALAGLALLSAIPAISARAQSAASSKRAVAIRVSNGPRVDGVMDDAEWRDAPIVSDFVQKIPVEGAVPSVRTEVRFVYDEQALYVGARLRRDDPQAIRTSVTRRDAESDAETFTVSLDTYLDRRTAYSFSVSSGGVRGDVYHAQDSEDSGREPQYDPVWSARAKVDAEGWTAEMRIPFSQLRFNPADRQEWGLELTRYVADKAERDQWVLIPIQAAGFSSRFGQLDGISKIRQARRIELLPYVASEGIARANVSPRNPFNDHYAARAGGDLKVGLGPNFTLDATFNPDFGQVEADPAVVNLTAFENVFEERRPFFTEGNELLTGRGQSFLGRPTWFYSRRIGITPHGTASGDFVDAPVNTTIAAAAKITGRTRSGLSLGAIAAMTPHEYARVYSIDADSTARVIVEPPTQFAVARMQQEFGSQQSNVGLSVTGVNRALDDRGTLAALLPDQAVAGGLDWKLRYRQGKYEVTGWLGGSYVRGDSLALARLQRNSAHFFQRPDQTHLAYDPARTAMSGATASVRLDKNAGRFTLGGIQIATRSPGFEINDAGQARSGDDIDFNADVQLRDTKPNRLVRFFNFGTAMVAGWNYGGVQQYMRFSENASATLHNFMRLSAGATLHLPSQSDDLTRGGPLIGTPRAFQTSASVASRANVRTTWSGRVLYFDDDFGGWRWEATAGVATRPAPQWSFSVDPTYSRAVDGRQYVGTRSGGSTATFGSRYVFAFIERSTVSARFRVNYAFTPNFTVEGYAEPFAASGRYYDFGELPAPRARTLRIYGAEGTGTTVARDSLGIRTITDGASRFTVANLDFNRLSFRSNLVLRWEWLPGSTAFLVWQQNRQALDPTSALITPRALYDATRVNGDNVVVAKISYWIGVR